MPRLFIYPVLSGEEKAAKKRQKKGMEGSRKGGHLEDPETWAANCAGRGWGRCRSWKFSSYSTVYGVTRFPSDQEAKLNGQADWLPKAHYIPSALLGCHWTSLLMPLYFDQQFSILNTLFFICYEVQNLVQGLNISFWQFFT